MLMVHGRKSFKRRRIIVGMISFLYTFIKAVYEIDVKKELVNKKLLCGNHLPYTIYR
jgi:hypothetical protein